MEILKVRRGDSFAKLSFRPLQVIIAVEWRERDVAVARETLRCLKSWPRVVTISRFTNKRTFLPKAGWKSFVENFQNFSSSESENEWKWNINEKLMVWWRNSTRNKLFSVKNKANRGKPRKNKRNFLDWLLWKTYHNFQSWKFSQNMLCILNQVPCWQLTIFRSNLSWEIENR